MPSEGTSEVILLLKSSSVYSNTCINRVFFRGVTWLRDSHGLFDYESRNIAKKNMKTQCQGKLFRVNNDIEYAALSKKEEDYLGVTQDSV